MFFFLPNFVFFCQFFFPGKVHMSFIHSIFDAEKKTTRKKNSFFIHSFDIPQKCTKTNLSGEIKKYANFGDGKPLLLKRVCFNFGGPGSLKFLTLYNGPADAVITKKKR